jgi:Holliday junction resolvase RusA-like endonuclease
MAFLAVPASWSNKKRDAALAGIVRHTGRPDFDNFAKIGCDALNGIVWADDSQIVEARIVKLYSESPSLRIEVQPLETMLGES